MPSRSVLQLYIYSYYYQNIYIVIIIRIVYSGTMNSELVPSQKKKKNSELVHSIVQTYSNVLMLKFYYIF